MKKCFIYIRVSTDKQAKEGASLDAQLTGCNRYAEEKNWRVLDTFIEEGISAKNDNRPEFQKMIKRLSEVDIILCFTQDRLLRSGATGEFISDLFIRENKELWCVDKGRVKLESPEDEFLFLLTSILGRQELKKDSKRIRATMRNITEMGYVVSGSAPLGYELEDKRGKYKKLLINEEQAKTVRFIYDEYERSCSKAELIRITGMTYNTISRILSNELYIGNYVNEKRAIKVEGFCEPIIEKAQFYRVQHLLKLNTKKPINPHHVYIFAGLLVCGECGCKYSGTTAKNSQYYLCRKKKEHRGCENAQRISEKNLEKIALDELGKAMQQQISASAGKKKSAPDYKKKRTSIEQKLDKLVDLYLEGNIDKDKYTKRRDELKEQLNEIEVAEQQAKQPPSQFLKLAKDASFPTLYNGLKPQEKKRFWRSIINKITINPDRFIIFDFRLY